MSTQTHTQHSLEFDFRTNRPWSRSLVRSFRRWLAWRREQRRVTRSINDLLEMNDHLLADIGLAREDIATGRISPRGEGRCSEHRGGGDRSKVSGKLCDFAAFRSRRPTGAR